MPMENGRERKGWTKEIETAVQQYCAAQNQYGYALILWAEGEISKEDYTKALKDLVAANETRITVLTEELPNLTSTSQAQYFEGIGKTHREVQEVKKAWETDENSLGSHLRKELQEFLGIDTDPRLLFEDK